MKKGDLRKESILKCAEELFLTRGYDDTSVQDILDALSMSKGGFYHYFESKQALLEAICRRNAEKSIAKLRTELTVRKLDAARKTDLILARVFTLIREESKLCALILKISYMQEDVNFREHMRNFMFAELEEMLDHVIADGIADGSFFLRRPKYAGRMLLMMAYDINDEVCMYLAKHSDEPEAILEIVDMTDGYRDAIETLLGAQFGSIKLFDMEQLLTAYRLTIAEYNKNKGE